MEQALDAYIHMLLETEEYQEYILQKKRIGRFPELKARIDAFRKRSFEVQNNKNGALDRIEELEKEYERLVEEPAASDFLEAELAFCRMMQRHGDKIMEAIDFE